jgi:hypothetical protein
VIILEPQAHAIAERQLLDVGPWQLQSARPVENGELLGHDAVVAGARALGAADRLRARPAIPDRHRSADVLGNQRVVGHCDDRRADFAVNPAK